MEEKKVTEQGETPLVGVKGVEDGTPPMVSFDGIGWSLPPREGLVQNGPLEVEVYLSSDNSFIKNGVPFLEAVMEHGGERTPVKIHFRDIKTKVEKEEVNVEADISPENLPPPSPSSLKSRKHSFLLSFLAKRRKYLQGLKEVNDTNKQK